MAFESHTGPCMLSLRPTSQKGGSKNFLPAARAEVVFAVGTQLVGWSVCLPVCLSVLVLDQHSCDTSAPEGSAEKQGSHGSCSAWQEQECRLYPVKSQLILHHVAQQKSLI